MTGLVDLARRALPSGLTGLAGLACAACCVVPLLLVAGMVGGAGWAAVGRVLPGLAVASVAAWWWVRRPRPHRCGCAGGAGCACGGDRIGGVRSEG